MRKKKKKKKRIGEGTAMATSVMSKVSLSPGTEQNIRGT